MTWLTRHVWHWPLWLLIACASGAIAQPDPQTQPPSKTIEVPMPTEVPMPNADSADPRPNSGPSASGPSNDALSDDALPADGPLREPAGPSSAKGSNGGDDFEPSEEISEDFSISLPVDI